MMSGSTVEGSAVATSLYYIYNIRHGTILGIGRRKSETIPRTLDTTSMMTDQLLHQDLKLGEGLMASPFEEFLQKFNVSLRRKALSSFEL